MELYDRLTAKGKQKKLALIAVSNKLLRQAFAIVKNKTEYDECFFIEKNCRITQFFARAKPEATAPVIARACPKHSRAPCVLDCFPLRASRSQ
jgi:hypothetical protein